MANKRDSTSQRRARENRARRAALEARTGGAAPARPSRVAPSTAEKLKKTASTQGTATGTDATATTGAAESGGKARRPRPVRPGDVPVDVASLEGRWPSRVMRVPGGTQALFAGVMAVAASALMTFTKTFVAERDIGVEGAQPSQTLFERYDLTVALPVVAVPLLVSAAAVGFSLRPERRRIWLGAAVVLGLGFGVALQLLLYLFVAAFFGYACYRSARVEGRNEPLLTSLRRRRRSDGETGDAPPADADAEER